MRVTVQAAGGDVSVAGTTIGVEDRHWLTSVLGYQIEIELGRRMVFFRYDDRPGVIGRVGTLFGDAGINIANMAVSRTNQGGKALMALSIDSPAPATLVAASLAAGFDDARFIRLEQ
jgi:D-3-phosphoglycerate dehydrogenase